MRHAIERDRGLGTEATTPRAMFERVLAAWAMDVLSLRRRGLDRPTVRKGAWTGSSRSMPGRWAVGATPQALS